MVTTTPTATGARRGPSLRILLAPVGDGTRRRLGSDVARLIASLFIVLVGGLLIGGRSDVQGKIVEAVHPPPLGISWLITMLWVLGTLGVLAVAVVITVLHHRLEVLRDLVVGAGIALAICLGLQWLFGTTAGFSFDKGLDGVNLGYPTPLLAAAAASALTIRPYLSRGLQRSMEGLIAVAVITGVWNLSAVSAADRSREWWTTLLVKLALVAASGLAAAIHVLVLGPAVRNAPDPASRRRAAMGSGICEGISVLAGLGALFLGVVLAG